MITTTLAKIKAAEPCHDRYKLALRKVGGLRKFGKDTPITVRQIVEAMGLIDAFWCLRMMPEHDSIWRLLAVRYARRVQHLMACPDSLNLLDVAERYANGKATNDELSAAYDAHWAVDWKSSWAVHCVACSVAAEVAAEAALWAADSVAILAADRGSEREWQAQELIRICEEELEHSNGKT